MNRPHITTKDALLDFAGSTGGTFMTQFVHGTFEVESLQTDGHGSSATALTAMKSTS
jgi:hypothetical protein